MSSFGSSLINKSGKTFAPRGGAGRRRPPPVTQTRPLETIAQETPSCFDTPVAATEPTAVVSDDTRKRPAEEPPVADAQEQGSQSQDGSSKKRRLNDGTAEPQIEAPRAAAVIARDAPVALPSPTPTQDNRTPDASQGAVSDNAPVPAPEPIARRGRRSAANTFETRSISKATSAPRRGRSSGKASLPTPPTTQAVPSTQRVARGVSAKAQTAFQSPSTSAVQTDDSEREAAETVDPPEASSGNWVITTPAQISKSVVKLKEPVKGIKEVVSKNKDKAKATSPVVDLSKTATGRVKKTSARVANLEKRRRRKAEIAATIRLSIEVPLASPSPEAGESDQENDEDGEEDHDSDPGEESGSEETSRRQRRERKRVETPEGAENVTIVPSVVTMYELAGRNRRTGLKSEREKKMQNIDWKLVKQRRREELERMAMERGKRKGVSDGSDNEGEDEDEDGSDIDAQFDRAVARNQARGQHGIQIRIVNGEHVIDEQSQRVNRHALANEDVEDLEEVEEDDLTKNFNTQTYIHLKRRDPKERIPSKDRWTTENTDKFYDCLTRFGTDFMIISKMFPGRTRRQIKAKFVKEEKSDPERVKDALSGLTPQNWDLEVFREEAGLELSDFKDPRVVEEELRVSREEREKLIEEQRKETEELRRQRRLAGELTEDEEEEEAEAGAIKKRERSRTGQPEAMLNDSDLEVVTEGEDND